ncbi:MAG: hypothetical protein KDC98_16110 [Planctomycetes bacterium]|nr:hypothetical protein [Planctomycetota bacterium]
MIRLKHVPICIVLAFAACGSGGSSDPVQGLSGPQQVTIVESSTGSNSAARLPRGVRAVAGSPYVTDQTRMWVRDDSMETLDTVNMILGSLSQTHYTDQTNLGPYRCLVADESRGGGGGERGQSGPSYEKWNVESTRASNSDPQVVKFWIEQDDAMGQDIPATIYGRLTVNEEPSDSKPLGSFSLHFKCLPREAASTSTDTIFQGYLRTVEGLDTQTEVEFYMWHGDPDGTVPSGEFHTRERVHVVGNPGDDSGRAYSEYKYAANNVPGMGGGSFTEAGEYQLQFNASYVALEDVTNGNSLDVKDRSNFDSYVFRYGLYDATTEDRVVRMSGFPVEDVNGNYGWAGFHGIWFPENVTLTNGMTVYRRGRANNTLTPYTVVTVPGRLEKRSRAAITLADIQNEDLEMFDSTLGQEIRARFTGADFVRVATRSNGQWTPESSQVSIAGSFSTGQWVNTWSQARGSVEFAWPATLNGSVPAFVWSSTTINADSPELANGDLTLHGYFHMLRANITSNQANWQNAETPYLPDATDVNTGNQVYVFDKETLMLQLGSVDVNFGTGVTVNSGPGTYGLNCGPLFATALTSFNEMPNQTTTYEWTIGSNDWNQLRTLKDADGNYVTFDEPLRFTYTHSEQGSPYDGRTFFLEWTGMDLHGIPYDESSEDHRWYPAFNIPTGTTLTAGQNTYKVKQLEGEQVMVSVNDPNTVFAAQGFDLGTPLSAPTSAPWTDPAIGAMPTITAAPLYVGGVLQSDG